MRYYALSWFLASKAFALLLFGCGKAGKDGAPGVGCSVVKSDGVTTITCGSQVTQVCDGEDGAIGPKGDPAAQPLGIQQVIDPCGDYIGHYDEVIFRLSDHSLMAYFEQSGNHFLTLLTPGGYCTTDGSGCCFSVDSRLIVTDSRGGIYP